MNGKALLAPWGRLLGALVAVLAPGWASALHFDFRPPVSVSDPAAPAIMRDLAARVIPVYQDPDGDRYLANLSALQLVAGDYATAYATRRSLEERRRKAELNRSADRGLIYDIYAHAKDLEAEKHILFGAAFATSFHEAFAQLDDRDAFASTQWLSGSSRGFRDALQKLFDKEKGKDRIEQDEAVTLIWTYMSFDAYRSAGPLVAPLVAEDEAQRYIVESDVSIAMTDGTRIAATVIRPKRVTSPLPALLEFMPSDSPTDAKESAAHGYAGVVAYPMTLAKGTAVKANAAKGPTNGSGWVRRPGKRPPFEHEGEDARLVITWIAAQSWSDGRVGMYGDGYGAYMPWAAAKHLPPALKAIASSAAMVPGIDMPMEGSIFQNAAYRWSLDKARFTDEAQWRALDQKWYRSGKTYRDLGRVYGKANSTFIRWLNHPSFDRYWQKLMPFRAEFAHLDIPVLTTTGYYAPSEPGDLYFFMQHHRFNPHADHTLLIGPYDDGAMRHVPSASLRGYQLDSAALVDLHEIRFQWFDHVLNGASLPAPITDKVNYQIMGTNEWHHASSIEAMGPQALRLYLDPGASDAAHRLVRKRRTAESSVDLTVRLADRADGGVVPTADITGKGFPTRDSVVFSSDVLTAPTEFSGLLSGRLDFTVNKMDLDLNLALYELLASGRYVRLYGPSEEFRASYVRDRVHRHLLKAGERQSLNFKGQRLMSRQLQAGSRLVLVMGVNKRPDREINYGTGNDVSAESIADAKPALKIKWFSDSYIDMPTRPPEQPTEDAKQAPDGTQQRAAATVTP
jgi:putative CocE/NonD family hydrolase